MLKFFSGGSSNLWKPLGLVAKQNLDFGFFGTPYCALNFDATDLPHSSFELIFPESCACRGWFEIFWNPLSASCDLSDFLFHSAGTELKPSSELWISGLCGDVPVLWRPDGQARHRQGKKAFSSRLCLRAADTAPYCNQSYFPPNFRQSY